MLSRCGSVLAQRRKRTSLVLCTSTSSSTTTRYLVNIIRPMPQWPCRILQACIGQLFLTRTKTRLWKTPSAGSAMSTVSGKFILKTGCVRSATLLLPPQLAAVGSVYSNLTARSKSALTLLSHDPTIRCATATAAGFQDCELS